MILNRQEHLVGNSIRQRRSHRRRSVQTLHSNVYQLARTSYSYSLRYMSYLVYFGTSSSW
jgi:hypothetical protein